MKKQLKQIGILLVTTLLLITFSLPVSAATYSENGTWKRKIGKTTWYFDVSDYTDVDREHDKYLGVVRIYKGKKNYNKKKNTLYAQYYRAGKNKYAIKYAGGKISFKVGKSKMTVKQVSGKCKGKKLKGTFKLVKRHYS